MARPKALSDVELAHLLIDKGLSYKEIAEMVGLAPGSVYTAARRAGLVKRKSLSHKRALPWTLDASHKLSKPASYLRYLSSLAQGGKVASDNAATAIRWAESIVSRGLDLDYDPQQPPNEASDKGGFFFKEADPDDWHLKKVLDEAKAGVLRRKM